LKKLRSKKARSVNRAAERRSFVSAEDARQARWDALPASKQLELLAEWNAFNPAKPGDDPRARVDARLGWCLETLEQRATSGGGVP
jgi:hypothetical protein